MKWILSFLLLMSCAQATPHFAGVPATRVEVDGSIFDVRVRGNLAEAVRVNRQYAPRLGPIRDRAEIAMAQASGCPVMEVMGDAAVTTGVLGCDQAEGRRLLQTVRSTPNYECFDYWGGDGYDEFQCYPY
ncbi:hypothetical protein AVO45_17775 [Ruegeria marisrubri]|uniref:Nuclease n=1 Tax=Ruegeria marisrubri TaxID=1685379 RepID=A0A0X3UAH6_9RHOB|nr:hypothetical protein [Ruegeria marisrubri]KUJ85105.1 hypothetical protein AVO45_17775 [Ruegeria marisrubri]